MRRLLASLVVGASLLVTGTALAESSPQDIAQARELGGQAQAAFLAGNLAESERLWLAAEKLYPAAPTLTLGLARAQAKLGKVVLAQESYNKIIREQSQATSLTPAFKDALEAAKNEIGAVQKQIANVVIRVESGSVTPTVTLDGQPVSAAGLGLERPVDPGAHAVHAEAPGYRPADTRFEVAAAGKAEAKLVLEKAPESVVAATTTTTTTTGESGLSTRRKAAIVAFGVGGAGLVFGAITGVLALSKHSDLADQCPNDVCPANLQDQNDSYKTMGTLSTVGFVVGGVGAVAGAALRFWPSSKEKSTAKVEWQPYVGLGGGGLRGTF